GTVGLGVGKTATATPREREISARTYKNKLFIPALTIPVVTLIGSFTFRNIVVGGAPLFDPGQITLVSLSIGVIAALFLARTVLKQPMLAAFQEGRKLMDLLGWASLLPQMLAALGAVFAIAGVGKAIGGLAAQAIPGDSRFAAVA